MTRNPEKIRTEMVTTLQFARYFKLYTPGSYWR